MNLEQKLKKVERGRKFRAFLATSPLLLFTFIAFLVPVAYMFYKSIDNSIITDYLPNTTVAIADWDGEALPDKTVFAALLRDIKTGAQDKTITRVGQRLNYEVSGISSLFRKSARKAKRIDDAIIANPDTAYAALMDIDKKWGDINMWRAIKEFSPKHTLNYYKVAFDFRYSPEQQAFYYLPDDEQIYLRLFFRTLLLSVTITFLTLLLGYPVAFLLTNISAKSANILFILVLLPFWTSLLVRTTAWIVLLQQQGVINELLIALGIISDAERLQMIHNMMGTIIAMTHILLPFMILPIYSVMKSISPSHMRAARSLGANANTAFWKVYFPQTLPGIGAGGILVFILAIGYYITPELVGGTTGTFISNRIAYHISSSLNWGLGAALGLVLLIIVIAMYLLYDRVIGNQKIKVM